MQPALLSVEINQHLLASQIWENSIPISKYDAITVVAHRDYIHNSFFEAATLRNWKKLSVKFVTTYIFKGL